MFTATQSIMCPHCGEAIEIVLDLSVPEQQYVEDCFVCCRPIVIGYRAREGQLETLWTEAESS